MDERYCKQLDSIEDLLKILVVNSVVGTLENELSKQVDLTENVIGLTLDKASVMIDFFNSIYKLKNEKIIRSSNYSKDVAEYIVSSLFDIELCKVGAGNGYDGTYISTNKRVQIKFHDGEKRTNIPFSENDKKLLDDKKVQDIIILLGRNSNIKPSTVTDIPYLIYKIPVEKLINHRGCIGKGLLKQFEATYKFNEIFENIC